MKFTVINGRQLVNVLNFVFILIYTFQCHLFVCPRMIALCGKFFLFRLISFNKCDRWNHRLLFFSLWIFIIDWPDSWAILLIVSQGNCSCYRVPISMNHFHRIYYKHEHYLPKIIKRIEKKSQTWSEDFIRTKSFEDPLECYGNIFHVVIFSRSRYLASWLVRKTSNQIMQTVSIETVFCIEASAFYWKT